MIIEVVGDGGDGQQQTILAEYVRLQKEVEVDGDRGMEGWTQLVFNDDVQNSFDLNMWVCVSTTFDVRRIKTAMLESATKIIGSLRHEHKGSKILLTREAKYC